ncbi:MAG: YcaO-like family protein [Candidatus Rokubacteria bacterium]|nr:YcaO-like family protein [Candidatus Rokubacteria bacterium]
MTIAEGRGGWASASTDGDPWAFPSTPKVDAGERGVMVSETYARVASIARRIPITRVADLTPLDDLRLPVYSAVTPLARDLKVHNGKGATREAARVSAMMEAVERVSAERWTGGTIVASRVELERGGPLPPVDPGAFELPADTAYRPDARFTWVQGRELLAGRDVLIPLDLVISPPVEGILRDVDTNGLASGNTHLEAVAHAICEVVERDALSQVLFVRAFGTPEELPKATALIDLGTLPAPARDWAERLTGAGLELTVLDITSDVRVPTFHALLVDPHYPTREGGTHRRSFFGDGTHPDPAVAVFRSLSEAIQARLIFIQAARDSYNRLRVPPRPTPTANGPAPRVRRFSEVGGLVSSDLRADLQLLLARLRTAGVRDCVAVDLTQPAFSIPVVRVRIAGLASYCVNMRRLGPRCLRHLL